MAKQKKTIIKEWLDELINVVTLANNSAKLEISEDEEYRSAAVFENYISRESYEFMPAMQMFRSVRGIADILGIECEVQPRDDEMQQVHFIYKGVMFFELEDKE